MWQKKIKESIYWGSNYLDKDTLTCVLAWAFLEAHKVKLNVKVTQTNYLDHFLFLSEGHNFL